MLPPFPRAMTITWTVTALTISDQGIETPQCCDCKKELTVHQPDEERPDQLLATCDHCGAWYLIAVNNLTSEAYLFDLPNVALIREAMASQRPKPTRKRSSKRAADGA